MPLTGSTLMQAHAPDPTAHRARAVLDRQALSESAGHRVSIGRPA
jgi:hypothetical protein